MKLWNLFVAAAALVAVSNVSATQISCPSNIESNVEGSVACEYSDTVDQDNTNAPLVVNTEAFFGFSDWEYNSKVEYADGLLQGEWTLSEGLFTDYQDVMLVMKSANGTTNLVGYLLDPSSASAVSFDAFDIDGGIDGCFGGVCTGDWMSPFVNPPFTDLKDGQTKATSHISFYVRGPQDVPAPAALMLLGVGLVGVWAARRRRK